MKESGPLGGHALGTPLRSANVRDDMLKSQDYSTHKTINVSQFNISQVYNLDLRSA